MIRGKFISHLLVFSLVGVFASTTLTGCFQNNGVSKRGKAAKQQGRRIRPTTTTGPKTTTTTGPKTTTTTGPKTTTTTGPTATTTTGPTATTTTGPTATTTTGPTATTTTTSTTMVPACIDSGEPGAPTMRALSNEEYLQSVRDLLEAPVGREILMSWTASVPVNGFDNAAWVSPDRKMVEDRIKAAEKLAELALASTRVMTCSPASTGLWEGCARQVAVGLAERAFRRPLSATQESALKAVFDAQVALVRTVPVFSPPSTPQRAPAQPGPVGSPIGWIDVVNDGLTAAGWALDLANPDRNVEVHIYIDGPPGSGAYGVPTVANLPRPDINNVYGVPGNHGFAFTLPPQFADGLVHTAYVYGIGGGNPALGGSPKQFGPYAPLAPPMNATLEALEVVFQSIFLSPQFLFKAELPPQPGFEGVRALDDYELASRLSFMFAASVPDELLREAARKGELSTADGLTRQVDRLLSTYSDRFARNYAGQWLWFRGLGRDFAPDSLESIMAEESSLVFAEVIRANLPLDSLLAPGFSFMNQQLAQHYGLSGVSSAQFQKVTEPARGGLLMQGGVMRATSSASSTNPIRRGLFVMGSLLCETIPFPSPALRQQIDASVAAIDPSLPLHRKMEIHRSAGAICMSCHKKTDPIGLGLESFDSFGRMRTFYADGKPVVSSSALAGTAFEGPYQLTEIIRRDPAFHQCVVKKTLTFAASRAIMDQDQCTVKRIAQGREGRIPTLREVITQIVLSNQFRKIRHGGISQ